jgi:hypothetical protein
MKWIDNAEQVRNAAVIAYTRSDAIPHKEKEALAEVAFVTLPRLIAIARVAQTLYPMIGRLGGNEKDIEANRLRCEYCHATDELSPNEVAHIGGCPARALREAMKEPE